MLFEVHEQGDIVMSSPCCRLVYADHFDLGEIGIRPAQFRVSLHHAPELVVRDPEHPTHLVYRHQLHELKQESLSQQGETVRDTFPGGVDKTVLAIAKVNTGYPCMK
jgi:hypothetical protein